MSSTSERSPDVLSADLYSTRSLIESSDANLYAQFLVTWYGRESIICEIDFRDEFSLKIRKVKIGRCKEIYYNNPSACNLSKSGVNI